SGCPFHPRCFLRDDRSRCVDEVPLLREVGPGHRSACHFAEEMEGRSSKVLTDSAPKAES
ncbi:MAG: hypothetical protein ACRDHO_15560, partial [Actinomycetota bacterium]